MTAPRHSKRSQRSAPGPGLFRDIVLDPAREPVPEARPVVSVRADDDPDFLAEVKRRQAHRTHLMRRGVDHGEVVALHPEGLVGPRPRRRRRQVIREQRWRAAQPILLPGACEASPKLGRRAMALHGRLEEGGLAGWLRDRGVRLAEEMASLADPDRDLARCVVADDEDDDAHGGLWVKAARLSTHPEDRSLRLRVSFGAEEDDDASRDEARHHATSVLARELLLGAEELFRDVGLLQAASECAGIPLYATQGLAYWNAPNGGARFHHDAFDEATEGGQRGVLYWQATGRTAWLALSIEDLAARVREMSAWIQEGELPWVAEDLARAGLDAARLAELTARRDVLLAELARPGSGDLGALVDYGPEFTALLADSGHVLILEPGDVLLLPNHGLDRTAMHSVFHAGGPVAYGLSWALREEVR